MVSEGHLAGDPQHVYSVQVCPRNSEPRKPAPQGKDFQEFQKPGISVGAL